MFTLWSWWTLLSGRLNSNPAVCAALFVLILLLNTSWSQSALLTLSTVIILTWIESWGPMNQRERERESFLFSCQETNILFFYCLARGEMQVVQLAFFSLAPHTLGPYPLSPAPVSLSFTVPLFSITAHIWFWVKARLVSSGIEGFLFLNGPTPSPVSFCGEEYAVCLQTGVPFFKNIPLNPHFHHWGTPQSSPINGRRGARMLVGRWSSRLSCGAQLIVGSRWLYFSRNFVHPGKLTLLATQWLSLKTASN